VHRAAHPTTTRSRVLGRIVPSVVGIGLAVVLTGCGAGQITQTDTQSSGVNGANANVGHIALRDVQLSPPPDPKAGYQTGAAAVLIATIVNTGLTSDSLVKVTTPAAVDVLIDGSPTGTSPLPANFAITSGQDPDDNTTAPGTLSAATTSGPSSAAPPSSSGAPSSSASATPSASVAASPPLAPGRVSIVLHLIKSVNGGPLRSGMTIPITFYFANAGQVTIDNVPIGAPPDSTAVLNPSGNG
jgi:copper(I)-binding protein